MQKIKLITIICLSSFCLHAQDTLSVVENDNENTTNFLEVQESVEEHKEAYLTRYLNYFSKRGNVEVLEEEDDYTPLVDADSLYEARLNTINTLMHLPYNSRVRAYIQVYVDRKRPQTATMLALSKYYFPIFERELAKHDMPEELKYLPVIESALNPRAGSPKGAAGLWQFMYRTGKMYGLRIDDEVDERYDPEKATIAATLYLKYLHSIYKDWTLAIAAYNFGPTNVNKAIRRAKGKRNYWDIYNFLPRETRNHVPAFIGAAYAMTFYKEHGIQIDENDKPDLTDTLQINRRVYFSAISEQTGIPVQTLRDYNPQYKKDYIPGEKDPYVLIMPVEYVIRFVEHADSIYAKGEETLDPEVLASETVQQDSGDPTKVTYRIRRGDNLSYIAKRFGVTINEIKEWNGLNSDLIRINETLTIYTKKNNFRDMREVIAMQKAQAAPAPSSSQLFVNPKATTHVVANQKQTIPVPQTDPEETKTSKPETKPATSQRNIAQNQSKPATKPAAKPAQQTTAAKPVATPEKTTPVQAQPKPVETKKEVVSIQPEQTKAEETRPQTVTPLVEKKNEPAKVEERPQTKTPSKTPTILARHTPSRSQTPSPVRPTPVTVRPEAKKTETPKEVEAPKETATPAPAKVPAVQSVPSRTSAATAKRTETAKTNVTVIQSKNTKNSSSKIVYYKVQKGETLFSIHRKHPGSNIQEIINMNNLRDNGNRIYPNQVLKIKLN